MAILDDPMGALRVVERAQGVTTPTVGQTEGRERRPLSCMFTNCEKLAEAIEAAEDKYLALGDLYGSAGEILDRSHLQDDVLEAFDEIQRLKTKFDQCCG